MLARVDSLSPLYTNIFYLLSTSKLISKTPVKTSSGLQSIWIMGSLDFIPSHTFFAGILHPQPPQQATSTTMFYFMLPQPIFLQLEIINRERRLQRSQAHFPYLFRLFFSHQWGNHCGWGRVKEELIVRQFCEIVFGYIGSAYSIEDFKMHHSKRKSYHPKDLTINFCQFDNPRESNIPDPFHRVKSEMLKRREKMAIRKKPMQYEKLENSLQQKLKQKSFNHDEQRDQLMMLEKCKSYFQLRRVKQSQTTATISPKYSIFEAKKRPQTCTSSVRNSIFFERLQGVMDQCAQQQKQEQTVKQNMGLFTFYCKMMDKRLQGIKMNIEKKQRMI